MADPKKESPDGGYPSIQIGKYTMYPDIQGFLRPTVEEAIRANQRLEHEFSKGLIGGCSQDPSNVSDGGGKKEQS
jgi:hypothetical protein